MQKKIRVAFWHNVFAPYRVPLFQRLAAFDDIDLTVYYGSEKDSYRAWTIDFKSGYCYVLLPYMMIPTYPYKFNYSLFSELVRQQYDVHLAVENEIGCLLTFLAARYIKRPFLVWSEEINYHIIRDYQEYTFWGCLKKMLPFIGRHAHKTMFAPLTYGALYAKRHADACVAAGVKTEEHLTTIGARGRIFRQGNSIDAFDLQQQIHRQDVTALQRALDIDGKTVVLSLCYLQKRKGVQYLIEAFLRMNRQDAVLLIVGDGEYKTELRKLIPEHVTNIRFLGHDEATAKYYALADIFVMPSFSDPWGLTVNEAMAAGLPVITTTNVGAQELVRDNGFVIPPRDSQSLQAALTQLLDNARLRQTMGQRSSEIIKEYTIEHTAQVCREAIRYCYFRTSG